MNTLLTNISGFPEFTPEAQLVFDGFLKTVKETYESFGAVPLETALVERVEDIKNKGGNDKEIYTLGRLLGEGSDDNNKALRFDLTTPTARYVAKNRDKITFPFKRYSVGPVFRGERAQAGRFRQFYQADIDIIGNESLSVRYDAEMPAIINQIFTSLDIGPFLIRINNRKILTGIFENSGIVGDDRIQKAMKVLDDLEKQGVEYVKRGLTELGATSVEDLISCFINDLQTDEQIEMLSQKKFGTIFFEGLSELIEVIKTMRAFGVPEDNFSVDLSIVRGLDYYTGTIYETKLINNPDIGSICSGGRYDNLTENFGNKRLPGVGISIGVTRLVSELLESDMMKLGSQGVAEIMVTTPESAMLSQYLGFASCLRNNGIKVDVYMENKKLGKQLSYACKKGYRYVLIADMASINDGYCQIKDLETQRQVDVAFQDLSEPLGSIAALFK